MSQLLLISVGPIQDFIQSARRCQDLWFGSWLLSDLARTVADALPDGSTVVFPHGHRDQQGAGVANLILAQLPAEVDPSAVASGCREAMQARLRALAQRAFRFGPDGAAVFHRERAMAQLDELMEFLWVAVPLAGDYATARRLAQARLAAVKNTRTWSQPPHAGPVPKSSLDGDRESVLDEVAFGWSEDRLRTTFGVRPGERLCGVGLLKRQGVADGMTEVFGADRPTFHSTAHLAAGPILRELSAAAGAAYVRRLEALGADLSDHTTGAPHALGGRYDGSLLYESRLDDLFERRPEQLSEARDALAQLLEGVTPSPYYAFLLADGDRMGKAISAIATLEGHQALSKALAGFAGGCRDVVAEHHGSLIFAGGDDVLALLPLDHALSCAQALAAAFATALEGFGSSEGSPTLSVGLAIHHAKEPMSQARAVAKRAEAKAKEQRNALCVWMSKRSGGDRELTGPWGEGGIVGWLDAAQEVLALGLSAKAAHDLEGVVVHFEGPAPPVRSGASERVDAAHVRAFTRQVLLRKKPAGTTRADWLSKMDTLLEAMATEDPLQGVRRLATALQLADVLTPRKEAR